MSKQNELWDDIPSYVFIELARRGMEKISLDQCFLPNCDNENKRLLEPLKKEEHDEKQYHTKIIYMKCLKCKGTYQLKFKMIKNMKKKKNDEKNNFSIGIVFAQDENGNNLGHIGYY